MNWRRLPVRIGSYVGTGHSLNNLPVMGARDHALNDRDVREVAGGCYQSNGHLSPVSAEIPNRTRA